MRKLLVVILCLLSFACKKSSQTCWKCTFGVDPVTGTRKADTSICNDGSMPQDLKDANGNYVQFSCSRQ